MLKQTIARLRHRLGLGLTVTSLLLALMDCSGSTEKKDGKGNLRSALSFNAANGELKIGNLILRLKFAMPVDSEGNLLNVDRDSPVSLNIIDAKVIIGSSSG